MAKVASLNGFGIFSIFFYDLEQFRLHANVVSLEDLLDQPTITHIVLHVSYSSIKSNFLPIVH